MKSMFLIFFMQNINFGDMMKLFYKLNSRENYLTLVYGPRQWVIKIETMVFVVNRLHYDPR